MNVRASIIRDSPTLKTTQLPFAIRTDIQTEVYSYSGIIYSSEMNEVWLQETAWIILTKFLMLRKKSKEYVVYYPIYILIKEQAKLMYGDRNQNSADLWESINWVGIGGSLLG